VTANCSALLPDYTYMFRITDNCKVDSIIQTPLAGTIIDSLNSPLIVIIEAIDNSANSNQVSFTVTLKDTEPPMIIYDSTLKVVNYQIIDELYDKADLALLEMMKQFKEDSIYYDQNLQVTSAPARALNGGYRFWQWIPKDSI
jgi:hypothetical protein